MNVMLSFILLLLTAFSVCAQSVSSATTYAKNTVPPVTEGSCSVSNLWEYPIKQAQTNNIDTNLGQWAVGAFFAQAINNPSLSSVFVKGFVIKSQITWGVSSHTFHAVCRTTGSLLTGSQIGANSKPYTLVWGSSDPLIFSWAPGTEPQIPAGTDFYIGAILDSSTAGYPDVVVATSPNGNNYENTSYAAWYSNSVTSTTRDAQFWIYACPGAPSLPLFPTNVTGLAVWLDAQTSFAGQADGSQQTNWPDRSPRGLTVTYTNWGLTGYVTNSGINGKLAVHLDGDGAANSNGACYITQDLLGPGANTFFTAAMLPVQSYPAIRAVFRSRPTGSAFYFDEAAAKAYTTQAYPGATGFRIDNFYTPGVGFVLAQTHADGSADPIVYRNGKQLTWDSTGTTSTNQYSGSGTFGGMAAFQQIIYCTNQNYGEFIMYSNVLSASQLGAINRYLQWHWGL